jgi:hypothetical protein
MRRIEALIERLGSHHVTTDAGIHELLTKVVDETSIVCSEIGGEIQGLSARMQAADPVPQ